MRKSCPALKLFFACKVFFRRVIYMLWLHLLKGVLVEIEFLSLVMQAVVRFASFVYRTGESISIPFTFCLSQWEALSSNMLMQGVRSPKIYIWMFPGTVYSQWFVDKLPSLSFGKRMKAEFIFLFIFLGNWAHCRHWLKEEVREWTLSVHELYMPRRYTI